MFKKRILHYTLFIFVSSLFVSCKWEVFLQPKSQDIAIGQTVTIKAVAGNDNFVNNISKVKRAQNKAAKITVSGAQCGSFEYIANPAPGAPYSAMSGNTVNTKTDHLGRVYIKFTGGNVQQVCTVTITVQVGRKKGTATVTVHPPTILGNDYAFQPDNPLTVVNDSTPTTNITVQYVTYRITRVEGEAQYEPGTWICIACPVQGDSKYPGGVAWGRWLTISPSAGIKYHLRRTTPSNCGFCPYLIRFKVPGTQIQ